MVNLLRKPTWEAIYRFCERRSTLEKLSLVRVASTQSVEATTDAIRFISLMRASSPKPAPVCRKTMCLLTIIVGLFWWSL